DLVIRFADFNESSNDDLDALDDLTFTTPLIGPTAINDSATAFAGVATAINVLANDGPAGTVGITNIAYTSGNGASVTVNTNGTAGSIADDSISYTSAAGFTGSDTFTYGLTNQFGTSMATVTVTVGGATLDVNSGNLSYNASAGANSIITLGVSGSNYT